LFQAVDLRDARMVQCREDLGLALEPRRSFCIVGDRSRERLYRHAPFQIHVCGSVDLSHPTGAEWLADFVRAEAATRTERHSLVLTVVIIRRRLGPRAGGRPRVWGP